MSGWSWQTTQKPTSSYLGSNAAQSSNRMGNDPFVDFPGELALLALGYTQPLQHFTSHLVTGQAVD